LALAAWLLVVSSAAGQAVLYVDVNATGAARDGSSWCSAFVYLQDALAQAETSGGTVSEIRVAEGVYKPDQGADQTAGNRSATFRLLNGVALRGGYAGCGADDPDERDIAVYETFLSGDLSGDDGPDFENNDENSYHVVTGSYIDATAVLDGFTITGGNSGRAFGGGISNGRGSPTLVECTFIANSASSGGAMYDSGGPLASSNPTVISCNFIGNRATPGSGTGYAAGGAVSAVDSGAVFKDCRFTRNHARTMGGAIRVEAGAPRFIDCDFYENSAVGGGAISVFLSQPQFTNCTLSGNTAARGGGVFAGYRASPILFNCRLSGNTALYGGGLYNTMGAFSMLTNCTIMGNIGERSGGGVYNVGASAPTFANCIVWHNTDNNGAGQSAQLFNDDSFGVNVPAIDYSSIQGWTGELGGVGNIGDDPLFVDADGPDDTPGTGDDNLRLMPGSPCIDAGDNSAVPESVTTDLDGHPRLSGDPMTPDTGSGGPPIVDMGAYEYQPVLLDIDPGKCPNLMNVRSRSPLHMAIVGTAGFDVRRVDLNSLVLTRADGVGGSVSPLRRRRGPAPTIRDVATPFHSDLCDCRRLRRDGIEDLLFEFRTREVADALQLHGIPRKTSVTLTVSGVLSDGTPFAASDCVVIQGRR
jgi:hypothetical protein